MLNSNIIFRTSIVLIVLLVIVAVAIHSYDSNNKFSDKYNYILS